MSSGPWPVIDRSTQRVIAVIALMIVAAWALRGYLPGGERVAEREKPPSNPAALVVVVVMLSAAVAIIGFAIIARMRDRRPGALRRAPCRAARARWGARRWRFSLIAARHGDRLPAARAAVDATGRAGRPNSPRPLRRPPRTPVLRIPTTASGRGPGFAEPESDTNVVGYLVPPMLMLMVLVVVGTAIASRRRRSVRPAVPRRRRRRRAPDPRTARRNPSRGQQKSAWPRSVT